MIFEDNEAFKRLKDNDKIKSDLEDWKVYKTKLLEKEKFIDNKINMVDKDIENKKLFLENIKNEYESSYIQLKEDLNNKNESRLIKIKKLTTNNEKENIDLNANLSGIRDNEAKITCDIEKIKTKLITRDKEIIDLKKNIQNIKLGNSNEILEINIKSNNFKQDIDNILKENNVLDSEIAVILKNNESIWSKIDNNKNEISLLTKSVGDLKNKLKIINKENDKLVRIYK